jgi:hypothetical protein
MNTTSDSTSGGRRSVLDEVAAYIRAMHKQDMLERKSGIRVVDRFEGIVVPEQPFCCPECGCREYKVICGMKECSWCQGKGRILGRPKGSP